MIYIIVKFFARFISTKQKMMLADVLLDDVLSSSDYSIGDAMADSIASKVVKSTGNKIVSYTVRD